MSTLTDQQVRMAIDEADRILFVVDGKDGLTSPDRVIAEELRQRYAEKVILVVNKSDRMSRIRWFQIFISWAWESLSHGGKYGSWHEAHDR